ncbi:MAG TPA: hypothetical protein VGF28_26995 [Thermoanaerobaculia bacterium]|jgi:hypothetical protein
MADKAWTDRKEFKRLHSELRALSRDAFADRALTLLRIRWPACIAAPRLRTIDRAGVDLFVWDDGQQFSLAVQCKGFEVAEERVGASQREQCLESIRKFDESDVRAERYLLVHNRVASDSDFRIPVETGVAELMRKGRVREAMCWDSLRFLREVFNALSERIVAALNTATNRDADSFGQFDLEPIAVVPIRVADLVLDRHHLESESESRTDLADPAKLLLGGQQNLTLLLGGAGYGKTTVARRAVRHMPRKVFFVPAARIDKRIVGAKDLLEQAIDIEDLLDLAGIEDVDTWKFIARAVIDSLLKRPDTNALLIFDGLDESPFLTRERGALQHFFNFFNEVRVPVVLTARTEFWNDKQSDLHQPFGSVGAHKGGIRKYVQRAELVDWNPPQMTELARRFKETITDSEARRRLDELIAAIDSDRYEEYYGDIPRRPLFLRMILDTVTTNDVHHVRRAQLVEEWALLKIERDVIASQRWGTSGRPSIARETSTRATVELSFTAMEAAARLMMTAHEGRALLLPDCEAREIAMRVPALSTVPEYAGLVLNSLLVPLVSRSSAPQRLRFAHLLFQEFFLARYLAAHREEALDLELPNETRAFLLEMT